MMVEAEFVDLLIRVEAEYREMPGLQLTEPQMRRLWGFDGPTSAAVIQILIMRGVLRETPAHQYVLEPAGR